MHLLTTSPAEHLRVFIVHWNSPVECLRTIEELADQAVPLRITVIDNRSTPQSLRALSESLPAGIELLHLDKNLGWGGAVNVALRSWVAAGPEELCVICAHDALPAPRCLSLIQDAMRADPQLGLACPEHGSGGGVQISAAKGVHIRHAEPGPAGSVLAMPAPHGTLSVLRRSCLRQIGIFDERYFAYGDETEIGFRAATMGWKSGMVWGAKVLNPGTSTSHRLRVYLIARNNILTVYRYFGLFAALVRIAVTLGSCVRPYSWANKKKVGLLRARLRGVLDSFAFRYGPPPPGYLDRR